jgi:hypothetical protein
MYKDEGDLEQLIRKWYMMHLEAQRFLAEFRNGKKLKEIKVGGWIAQVQT